jgi:6-phosphogluconolactonase
MFTGCTNRAVGHAPDVKGKGIEAWSVDSETGAAEPLGTVTGIDNPSYVKVSPDGTLLAAVEEVDGWNEGNAILYAIDRATGGLTYLNKQPTRGSITCHFNFSPDGRFGAIANYSTLPAGTPPDRGTAVYRVSKDGLSPVTGEAVHPGHGPDPQRQERSHAHCALWSPDGRHLLVADLGLDGVMTYAFDDGAISFKRKAGVPAGSGPRHLAFHPNGRHFYVVNELSSTLSSFAYEPADGALTLLHTESTLPEGGHPGNSGSALKVRPDGRFLYAGNRGHNSVARFAIGSDGVARLVGTTSTQGDWPRDFDIDKSGKVLAVGNQQSHDIRLFRIGEDGDLTAFGQPIPSGGVTAIAFVN